MSLYARSDLMSVSIPVLSGGCGATHVRSVTHGAPAKVWKLDCPPCESFLRGDAKPKVIKVIPGDKDQGIPNRMEHVIDGDPQWSTTLEAIPPTPDEQHINKIRVEKAQQRLSELQALAAVKAAGLQLPEDVTWLLERNHDPRIVKGEMVCPAGHSTAVGAKFCNECGAKMQGTVQIGNPDGQEVDVEVRDDGKITVDALPLRTLHVSTLRKMARNKGLNDKGTKAQLIERLEA